MLMEGLARKEPPGAGIRLGAAAGSDWRYPSGRRPPSIPRRRSRDHLGNGKLSADLPCRFGADTQILSHPVHSEAEVELVLDHGLAAVLHLPGLRRALRDHVEHEFRVQAGLDGEVETFGQAL